MRTERALVAAAALLLALTATVAGLVPGIVASEDENVRPARLDVVETTVAAPEVRGSTVTLGVDSRLSHRGGPAENVTVVYRVTDAETGLVATTREVELGTVADGTERAVPVELTVEREGGYRIETIVYEDGRRRTAASTRVSGVGILQPAYAESTLSFERFDTAAADLPTVEYTVRAVEGDRAQLNVSAYLTNAGDEPAGDVRVELTARQAESGIVADRARTRIDTVRPGRTTTASAPLTVPDGYNYYLDAVLRRDGVVIDTARAGASLDPTETVPTNTTTREVGIEVAAFTEEERPPRDPAATTAAASGGQPGFGPLAALAALVTLGGGLLLSRRWSA
jgi:hypothetical protein